MPTALKIVVASSNPVKLAAARGAFTAVWPDATLEVIAVDVESGVSAQPRGDMETRQGARTCARNAMHARDDADYWVGQEGGVQIVGEQLMGFAWMTVAGRCGHLSDARSVTLPLPPRVRDLVASGLELGEANDRVFATSNSKHGGGAFGLLSDGLHTRESVYMQTIVMALIPFSNALYPCARHSGAV